MGTPLHIWGGILVEQPSKAETAPPRLGASCFLERMAHPPVPLAPWEDGCPAALLSPEAVQAAEPLPGGQERVGKWVCQ